MFFIRTSDNHRICVTSRCSVEISYDKVSIMNLNHDGRFLGLTDFYFAPGTKLEVVEKT